MAKPFVRVDVWSLKSTDPIIKFYGDAVAAMQAKPLADVTSWLYQSAIHGTHTPGSQPSWNECRHQGWFFVSWHRAYVFYFERIVRAQVIALGGPAKWALPYWNYDWKGHNSLPLAFRSATRKDGSPNPLFVAGRSLTGGAGIPSAVTSPAFAMSRTTFTGASEFGGGSTGPIIKFAGQTGRLEQTPHNDIHNMIGGLMLDPKQAAADPIFWLHHCNIDRLWWLWQKTHANPTAAAWKTPAFKLFDAGGVAGSKSSADVEDTIAQLDYTYKMPTVKVAPKLPKVRSVDWPSPWPSPSRRRAHPAAEPNPGALREMIGGTSKPVQLSGSPVRVSVPVDQRAAKLLASASDERQHRAFLEIDDVEAERNPGAVYGVYVQLPETPSKVDLAAHHVGNVSLFGVERARDPNADSHPHALRFSMEITDVLNRLAAANKWNNGAQVDVTFRPLTLEPDPKSPQRTAAAATTAHANTPIRIGRISVHYQ